MILAGLAGLAGLPGLPGLAGLAGLDSSEACALTRDGRSSELSMSREFQLPICLVPSVKMVA